MFPDGAFLDHAKRRTIFAATEDGMLYGYLLFRITKSTQKISITHLCINANSRGKGTAVLLLNYLRSKYANTFRGISLSCRKDYDRASKLWERYGFKAINSTRSRSKEEHYLTHWWYDFGNSDLFSGSIDNSQKIFALLDANIIIKLRDAPSDGNAESEALAADWLADEADFYYAPEIFNEINRDPDLERATATRDFLKTFKVARFQPRERDSILENLSSIIPFNSINNDSDRKQLSECIASGISYFITLDDGLLTKNTEVYTSYGVSILRPAEFILFLDHNANGRDYNSYRLAGVHSHMANIKNGDLEKLCDVCWLLPGAVEKKYQLREKITNVISDIKNGIFKILRNAEGNCIAYFALRFSENHASIPLLRILKGKISDILLQQILREIISLSNNNNAPVIILEDDLRETTDEEVLQSIGFEKIEGKWTKVICNGLINSRETIKDHPYLKRYWNTEAILAKLSDMNDQDRNIMLLQIERKLSPVKFSDIKIPTYIVPIKANWAGELFDHYISGQNLFGAKPELSWNRENVYYRSVNPVSESAPARILWYVSEDPNSISGRCKCIVACSYLDEVHIGPAKILFKKFKNYGIYQWHDILRLTTNAPEKEIKVLKFIDTNVFHSPVSLRRVHEVLANFGRPPNTFASPLQVSHQIFNEIYRIGNKL